MISSFPGFNPELSLKRQFAAFTINDERYLMNLPYMSNIKYYWLKRKKFFGVCQFEVVVHNDFNVIKPLENYAKELAFPAAVYQPPCLSGGIQSHCARSLLRSGSL
jgi:hypothetical protein